MDEETYGCYRCGVQFEEDLRDPYESIVYPCSSCGETSVISFTQSLDLVNDLILKGVIDLPYWEAQDEDDFLDFEED